MRRKKKKTEDSGREIGRSAGLTRPPRKLQVKIRDQGFSDILGADRCLGKRER